MTVPPCCGGFCCKIVTISCGHCNKLNILSYLIFDGSPKVPTAGRGHSSSWRILDWLILISTYCWLNGNYHIYVWEEDYLAQNWLKKFIACSCHFQHTTIATRHTSVGSEAPKQRDTSLVLWAACTNQKFAGGICHGEYTSISLPSAPIWSNHVKFHSWTNDARILNSEPAIIPIDGYDENTRCTPDLIELPTED